MRIEVHPTPNLHVEEAVLMEWADPRMRSETGVDVLVAE